jgi:hypothetical protein
MQVKISGSPFAFLEIDDTVPDEEAMSGAASSSNTSMLQAPVGGRVSILASQMLMTGAFLDEETVDHPQRCSFEGN